MTSWGLAKIKTSQKIKMQNPVQLSDPFTGNPLPQSDFSGDPLLSETFEHISEFLASINFDEDAQLMEDFPFADTPAISPDVPMDDLETTPFQDVTPGRIPPTPDAPRKCPRQASVAAMKKPCARALFKPIRKAKPFTVRFLGHKGAVIHRLEGKRRKKNKIDGGYFVDVDAKEIIDKILAKGGEQVASMIPLTMTHLDFGRQSLGYAHSDQGVYTVRPPKTIPIKFGADGDSGVAKYDPIEQCYVVEKTENAVNASEPDEDDIIDLSQEPDTDEEE